VAAGKDRVQEGARAEESDPARRMVVQLAVVARRPEKKIEPAPPATRRVLPMELQVGDRFRRRDRGVGSRRPALHVSGREERPRSRAKDPSQRRIRIARRRSGVHAGVPYVADSHTTPAVLSAEGCRLVTLPSSFSSQRQALNAGSAAYKRCQGLRRCRYRGARGIERWSGSGRSP